MAKKKRVGVVAVQIKYQHPKYAKTLIKTKKFMAHDEQDVCNLGDVVLLEESAPFSKRKTWVLKDILKQYLN